MSSLKLDSEFRTQEKTKKSGDRKMANSLKGTTAEYRKSTAYGNFKSYGSKHSGYWILNTPSYIPGL